MATLTADEHRQVVYALNTYGGDAGKRLAAELTSSLQDTDAQQDQGSPNGGQQETQQEA